MPCKPNAAEFLAYGDFLRTRVKEDGTTVAKAAAAGGLLPGPAQKAYWLSGVFDASFRRKLGPWVLRKLSPMHLEVVARHDRETQAHLLRTAAKKGVTARELKKLGDPETASASGGTADALRQSARAMEHYVEFDDRSLETLLEGPNGDEIRKVASAGQMLAGRLAMVAG